jgi:hypothetical protein
VDCILHRSPSFLPSHLHLITPITTLLLASQRLTRSGQGETDFNYFKLFLETVLGFPSVVLSMPGYYVQFPATSIRQQSLATLFPYLEKCGITWSGPTPKVNQVRAPKAKKAQRPPRTHAKRDKPPQHPNPAPSPRWGPNGPVTHAAVFAPPPTYDISDNVMFLLAENFRLNAATATMGDTMGGSPNWDAHSGTPVPPPPPPPLTPTSLLTTGHTSSTAGSMGLTTPTMDVTAK